MIFILIPSLFVQAKKRDFTPQELNLTSCTTHLETPSDRTFTDFSDATLRDKVRRSDARTVRPFVGRRNIIHPNSTALLYPGHSLIPRKSCVQASYWHLNSITSTNNKLSVK